MDFMHKEIRYEIKDGKIYTYKIIEKLQTILSLLIMGNTKITFYSHKNYLLKK